MPATLPAVPSFHNARVLLLSAHTDDCELGMGATIARLVREGAVVHWHVFCNAAESLPAGFSPQTLLDEQKAAAAIFGIAPANLTIHDFPVRRFPENRQDILELLVQLKRSLQPDFVFCAARSDCHQDHEALTREAFRAFKNCTLLGYQLPWNSREDLRQLMIEVAPEDAATRGRAIAAYASQAHRPYFRRLSGTAFNQFYGSISGYDLAEVFEVISMSWPNSRPA